MKKLEAEATTKLRRWLQDHVGTGAFEIKHTRGLDRFDLRELHEHQKDALAACSSPFGFSYKIPDEGRGYKPFDLFVLKGVQGWVVIVYPQMAVVIQSDKMEKWQNPSISCSEAMALSSFMVKLSGL